jgi:hypothetical protein
MIPTVIIGFKAPPNLPDSRAFTSAPKHFIYPIDASWLPERAKIMQSRFGRAAQTLSSLPAGLSLHPSLLTLPSKPRLFTER